MSVTDRRVPARRAGPDPKVASTTGVVRLINERAIYDHVLESGAMSVAELVASTTLSKPTVLLGLENLERAGLLQHAVRTGSAGRAPRVYEVRPAAAYVMSLDVGAAWIRLAIADIAGTVVHRLEVAARVKTADVLRRQIRDLTQRAVSEVGLQSESIMHTVLAGPGSYDSSAGVVRWLAPNVPGWSTRGFIPSLQPILGGGLSVENDINMAALGEAAFGHGQNSASFVFVSVGTGIGMGIVLDGQLYRGARQAAGEISFLPTDEERHDRPRRTVREHGSLESAAGAQAIVRAARAAGMTGIANAEQVFNAAREGDAAASEAVSAEAEYVARAVGAVVAVMDPELVVIGGGIGHNVDLIIDPVRQRLRDFVPLSVPTVEASALGTDAVLLGGLASALHHARDLAFHQATQSVSHTG